MDEIRIIRSRRRTLSLSVDINGELIVRAPLRMSEREIISFISSNEDWIKRARENALRKKSSMEEKLSDVRVLTEAEINELILAAKRVIPERVRYYAPLVGVDYGRITIRCQRTRWGSCSSKGNLNFNLALMRAPLSVLDYVVVHELCHRKHMDHSKLFWSEVERVMPDYRAQKKWIRENGRGLMYEVGII